jgi:putative transposase
VRFAFVKQWCLWSVGVLCDVMQVTARGFRKWLTRPMSSRQRGDMKVLAHIREQYGLSFGSYGRLRMTMELKEAGLDVGERRVGRLMKINGIKPVRTRKSMIPSPQIFLTVGLQSADRGRCRERDPRCGNGPYQRKAHFRQLYT